MNIREIIEAAKRCDADPEMKEDCEWFLLREHAIRMAEALVKADKHMANADANEAAMVIGDALAEIEKEYATCTQQQS